MGFRHEPHSSQGAAGRQQDRDRLLGRARHALRGGLAGPPGSERLRLHGRPGAARRGDPVGHPAGGAATRRQGRAPDRLPRRPGARGVDRHPVRRVPPRRRRAQVLQHHAARPRGDHHRHRPRDERGRRRHLQRREHAQGERHPALLPLRRADQPGAHHLQAVARSGVRDRVRRTDRDERVPGRDQAAVPHGRREGLQHRRQLPGRHARGQGPGVPRQGDPDREPDHGRRLLEAGGERSAGGGHRRLRAGAAGQPERQALRVALRALQGLQRRRRPARPRA